MHFALACNALIDEDQTPRAFVPPCRVHVVGLGCWAGVIHMVSIYAWIYGDGEQGQLYINPGVCQ